MQFGEVVNDTNKGTVAHVCPPRDSVLRQHETATPSWIIFPKYREGSETHFDKLSPAQGLLDLAGNAFNYHIHGIYGFECLKRLADKVVFSRLHYSDLDDVIHQIEEQGPGST
jgi:hypothetical protein